jgi:hypothetical protein
MAIHLNGNHMTAESNQIRYIPFRGLQRIKSNSMKKSTLFILTLASLLIGQLNVKAQVAVQITVGPPMIPVYVQPPCPVEGYIWTPGYWAWGDGDYYWVPGVWLYPAQPLYLWTPGYWVYENGYYGWNDGYWGPHVGYYGGVYYGHGYEGEGYSGGYWERGSFRYNTAVTNVNTTVIHNTYVDNSAPRNGGSNRASYNGPGGITAKPTPRERTAMAENHAKPVAEQQTHQQNARKDKSQFASVNKGQPAIAAVPRIGAAPAAPASKPVNGAAAKPNSGSTARSASTTPAQHGGAPQTHTSSAAPAQRAGAPQSLPHQSAAQGPGPAPRQPDNNRPQQHAAPAQQHNAPMEQHAAPQQQRPEPPQQHAAPQPRPEPPQQRQGPPPEQHQAPPQQHSAPPPPMQQPHEAPHMGGEGGHPRKS